jgi:hypothetical protein
MDKGYQWIKPLVIKPTIFVPPQLQLKLLTLPVLSQ